MKLSNWSPCAIATAIAVFAGAEPPQRAIPVDGWFSTPHYLTYWGESAACHGGYVATNSTLNKLLDIYRRTTEGWQLWQQLPLQRGSGLVWDVRMHGDYLCLLENGGNGRSIRIYRLIDEFYQLEQSLQSPEGESWSQMDFDGERIAVNCTSSSICVKTFVRDTDGVWTEEAESLLVADTSSWAARIRLGGDWIAVGRSTQTYGTVNAAGVVFLAKRDPDTGLYLLCQTLIPSPVQYGLSFGEAVYLSGSDLVVCAPGRSDGLGGQRGIVFHYRLSDKGIWLLAGTISSPVPQSYERFGSTLWTDGTRLVIGTKPSIPVEWAPRAWTFVQSPDGSWIRGAAVDALPVPSTTSAYSKYRYLACDGSTLAISEHFHGTGGSGVLDRHLVMVDRLFDCDENGIDDALEIASGATDCDFNRRPDDCDALAGEVPMSCTSDCDGDGILDWEELAFRLEDDCNGNQVPDSCDIASGLCTDLDGNGVPDSCEPDCDGNGIPDSVELAGDPAEDCDANALPDSCPHYRSGVSPEDSFTWYISGAYSYAHIAQRFVAVAGREAIHQIEFDLGSYVDTSYKPVRIALYREESAPDTLPIEASLVWYVDTYSGPMGSWSPVSVPGIVPANAGDAFYVMLIRKKEPNSSLTTFGGGYFCDNDPSEGCASSWYAMTDSEDSPTMSGVLSAAFPSPTAMNLRVWGSPCALCDLDDNGIVNGADLGIMLSAWGYNPGSTADINGDQFVNGEDLGILLGEWS